MPITQSAQKALRQNLRRKIRNLRKKRTTKKLFKQVKFLLSQEKIKEARKLLPQIYKAIDKSAKTGMIKKNKAAREKSKIAKLLNQPRVKNQPSKEK